MVPKGWEIVVDYYKHIDSGRWVPWSRPVVEPGAAARTEGSGSGKFGTLGFQLKHKDYESFWHDVPMAPSGGDSAVVNLVTEIPLLMAAKMEVQKALPGNPIAQDSNADGSPRYYTYGTPFFNYGYIPQTWEDPALKDSLGNGGDNDPLDVMEIGSVRLEMGSITPCRVLGHLELIDEGEMDNKILCIALSDPDADRIHSIGDLERAKPGTIDRLKDWLKRYKTSDGKPENSLASEDPTDVKEALELIKETHERWKSLCGKGERYVSGDHGFWLAAAGCKGTGSR
jgi:3'-phosphoadenosine 5'-phosphosulfate synthase